MSGLRRDDRLEAATTASAQGSSAILHALVDRAPVGMAFLDREMRYTVVNETLAATNGLRRDEHFGRTVYEVVPDLAAQVRPILEQVWQSGEPAIDVLVSGHTAASPDDVHEWAATFYRVDAAGEPHGIGVVVTDVTDRRRAERRLRQLIDGLFTFVGLCDPDGTLIEANRTALDAAGLEPGDVLGRPFWDTYWWSYDPAVQRQLHDAVERARSGEASRYDVDVRVKGDELLTIDFQLVPILEGNVVTAIVPSGMDIGERRRNERQLEATAALARGLTRILQPGVVIDVGLLGSGGVSVVGWFDGGSGRSGAR